MPLTTKAMLRCLILGAAGGVAGLVLFAAPAYADDDTQPPGGLLGAVVEVVEVVDQVIPDVEPTKAPEPEPTKDPEPAAEPADEPGHGTDGHDEPAAEEPTEEPAPVITVPPIEIPVDLPPVVIDLPPVVVDLPPLVVDVPPVVVVTPPIAVTPPVVPPVVTTPTQQPTTPTPTTDTTTPAPTTTPQTPAEVPAAPLDELPVVIGPTAGTGTLLPGLMREPGAVEHRAAHEPECTGDQPADAAPQRTPGGDREQARRTADQPANGGTPPAKPCPTPTGPGDTATGMSAALAHTTHGADQPPGDTTATLAWPALDRLHHVRARGDIPASRTTHLEPGPA
ncbi:hypothetical protein OHA01_26495 [Micromonospora zamorensis]|uniref:hypothetical protein n=1 Tax=Micromonospora zamorensis TaxID=709883 RepID=UPI003869FD7C|nr:hypothetical protein OHA01_26495 [Micromonospora zamorensis]